ncbi:MAG: hypothetical protein MK179_12825 [Pirellulaceae bacterium]|nr:hypothetical protein [Pirellulaceae bacterium]
MKFSAFGDVSLTVGWESLRWMICQKLKALRTTATHVVASWDALLADPTGQIMFGR